MAQRRELASEYIEWAKLHSQARYALTGSDVVHVALEELGVRLDDLQLFAPGAYGYPPLAERLAAKFEVAPEQVVLAEGTSMANHLAMAALLEPGDEVLIEQPAYEPLLALAQYLGAQIRRFGRDFEAGFQADPREVERAISPRTRLIVLTNLHNPSGARTPDPALRIIGDIARSIGAHVLVDEVYLETCFGQDGRAPVSSAFHLGANFIVTSSLTKAYGLTGLRCGWVLAAPNLARRMWRLTDLFYVTQPRVTELLSLRAFERLPELAARSARILAANRAILKQFLDSRKDLYAIWPEAGPIVFPQLDSGRVDALVRLLNEKYETSIVPGRFFEAPAHFRIGVGGRTDIVREALARLGAALDELGSH